MQRSTLLLFVVLISASFVCSVQGAIYSYRDEHGRLYLTDNPPNDKYRIVSTTLKDRAGPATPANWGAAQFHTEMIPQKIILPNDERFSEYINAAGKKYGLDPYLIKAIIKVESDFDPHVMSSKGAQGLMQLIPSTAKLVGCSDSFDPYQNILGGSKYLKMMLSRFNNNLDHALAAYNAGPGRVDQYGGVPPFRETKNYVTKVNHYYNSFREGLPQQLRQKTKVARIMPVIPSNLSKKLISAYECFKEEDVEGAIKAYQEILNIYPRNAQALYNLACLLDMERRFDEAIDSYNEALKEDPFLDKAIYNLAIIYERLGQYEEAIAAWRKYMLVTKEEEKIIMAERFVRELQEYSSTYQ